MASFRLIWIARSILWALVPIRGIEVRVRRRF
jgi:hypothetical protein